MDNVNTTHLQTRLNTQNQFATNIRILRGLQNAYRTLYAISKDGPSLAERIKYYKKSLRVEHTQIPPLERQWQTIENDIHYQYPRLF